MRSSENRSLTKATNTRRCKHPYKRIFLPLSTDSVFLASISYWEGCTHGFAVRGDLVSIPLQYENTNSADHCIDRCLCSPIRRSKRAPKARSRRPSNGSKNIFDLEVQEIFYKLILATTVLPVTQERPAQPGHRYMPGRSTVPE